MGRRRATLLLVVTVLGIASPAVAGHVLFDVAERHVLEAADADTLIEPGRVADLLLVAVLQERLATGALDASTRVPVLHVPGDREPAASIQNPLEIGELLQLLLLSDSPTAAKSLAWAVGPSIVRALTRMHEMALLLGLRRTTISDDWPFVSSVSTPGTAKRRGGTTVREMGRLALTIASNPEMRRRLALDGVPIADGGLIVRATAPLIVIHEDGGSGLPAGSGGSARIAMTERQGLDLLAVATGPDADQELAATLERGFARHRRVEVIRVGQVIGPTVRVRGGMVASFNAVASEPWAMTTGAAAPTTSVAFRVQLPTEIEAPIELHQPLGELVIERGGQMLAVVPLIAPQAIAPSGWFDTARGSSLP